MQKQFWPKPIIRRFATTLLAIGGLRLAPNPPYADIAVATSMVASGLGSQSRAPVGERYRIIAWRKSAPGAATAEKPLAGIYRLTATRFGRRKYRSGWPLE